MSAQESQTCMRIPKLCSLQGWKATQLTLEDSSAQSSNWRAFARAGDSISWSRKRTLRRLRGKGKNCDFLLNLYTHVDIFTCVYSIYAYRMTFDYVCARRNEIDPKGPCHIYIYVRRLYHQVGDLPLQLVKIRNLSEHHNLIINLEHPFRIHR